MTTNEDELKRLQTEVALLRGDFNALTRQVIRINTKLIAHERERILDRDRLRHRLVNASRQV